MGKQAFEKIKKSKYPIDKWVNGVYNPYKPRRKVGN
jgi:hypothetical protein